MYIYTVLYTHRRAMLSVRHGYFCCTFKFNSVGIKIATIRTQTQILHSRVKRSARLVDSRPKH